MIYKIKSPQNLSVLQYSKMNVDENLYRFCIPLYANENKTALYFVKIVEQNAMPYQLNYAQLIAVRSK